MWPDTRHPTNQLYSAIHRFGSALPKPTTIKSNIYRGDDEQQVFKSYAKRLIRKLFVPLNHGDDVDLDTYLRESQKPASYLERVCNACDDISVVEPQDLDAESFGKREGYPEYKHLRGINAVPDKFKAVLGPFIAAFDKRVFETCNARGNLFVKKIPVRDRPEFMEQRFGCDEVFTTDFSSFECHHRGVFNEIIWFLFHHILRNVAPKEVLDLVREMYGGTNTCRFNGFTASIVETLMSGALWTSSSNGALNMLIMSFIRLRSQYPQASPTQLCKHFDEFNGCFEGDDGIASGRADVDLASRLGINLKFEQHKDFTTASFCGIVKNHDSPTIFTDPTKTICNFFVLEPEFATMPNDKCLERLRAKALSYYYQYHDTPVVGPLAYAVLQYTNRVAKQFDECDIKSILELERNYHRRECLAAALEQKSSGSRFYDTPPNVDYNSRLFCEEIYGVSLEWQLSFEHGIDRWSRGLPHTIWLDDNYDRYTHHASFYITSDCHNRPLINKNDFELRHQQLRQYSQKPRCATRIPRMEEGREPSLIECLYLGAWFAPTGPGLTLRRKFRCLHPLPFQMARHVLQDVLGK